MIDASYINFNDLLPSPTDDVITKENIAPNLYKRELIFCEG